VEKKEQLKTLLSNTNALLGAMRNSTSTVSGEAANIGRYSSFRTFMRKYNDLVGQAKCLSISSPRTSPLPIPVAPQTMKSIRSFGFLQDARNVMVFSSIVGRRGCLKKRGRSQWTVPNCARSLRSLGRAPALKASARSRLLRCVKRAHCLRIVSLGFA
jgi:hypothetical protein